MRTKTALILSGLALLLNSCKKEPAQRNGEEIFDALITDHVPALADHPAWQGVTFSHTLNMVTGTEGGEGVEISYCDLVHANVLVPLGAEDFTLRRTIETEGSAGLPLLGYGA